MGNPVTVTATPLKCSMGLAPLPVNFLPIPRVMINGMPVGRMTDIIPFLNFSFVMCKSPANPAVAAIIAASLGSVTQGPCIPTPVSPWLMPAFTVLASGVPVITKSSPCICAFGGEIKVLAPIQFTVMAG